MNAFSREKNGSHLSPNRALRLYHRGPKEKARQLILSELDVRSNPEKKEHSEEKEGGNTREGA